MDFPQQQTHATRESDCPESHRASVRGKEPRRRKISTSSAGTISCFSGSKLALITISLITAFFTISQIAPTTPRSIKTSTTVLESTTTDNEAPESPKPTVVVLATGGTILGKGSSPTDTSHYVSGAFDIDSVIDSIRRDLEGIAHVVTRQIFSTDSINIHTKELITILHDITEDLRKPDIAGVVWARGTTTMLTDATVAEHTIRLFNKTLLLTGAIKPLTAYGSEGRGNLLAGVRTVATRRLNRVVILMNDKIMLTRRSYKHNNVFVPGDGSLLGSVVNFLPEIYNEPRDSPKIFDIEGLKAHDKLPRAKYFHPMMDEREFDSAIMEGVEGAVLGTYDDGYWPDRLIPGLKKLTDQDGFIAAAVSYGHTFDIRQRIEGVVPARDWTDRSLMMMMPFLLSSNMSRKEIREFIAEPYVKNERASCAIECI